MKRLSHEHLLTLSVGSLFPLGWIVKSKFCGYPQGSCRYAHSQFTRQLTDDEEEELVRNLVQDAFSPSRAAIKFLDSEPQPGNIRQNVSSTDPTLSEDGNGNGFQAAVLDGGSGPSDALTTVETDSRTVNKPYEKFARVRLRPYAYTVEELRDIKNRETNMEWMCMHCQTFNFMGRKSCRHCGVAEVNSHRERHPPTRFVVSFPTSWICEGCGHPNTASEAADKNPTRTLASPLEALSKSTIQKHRTKFFCTQCLKPFGGVREWYCPYCDHVNSKASTQCSTCLAERPVLWKCGGCEYTSNSIFSIACFRCKKRRLMKVSNSTVLCPGCGVRNDCRWELCEACMSPLPAMTETVGSEKLDRRTAPIPGRFPPQDMDPIAVSPQQRGSEHQTGMIKNDSREGGAAESLITSAATSHRTLSTSSETNGAWWCTKCNIIQRRNAIFCDVCLRPRHLAEEKNAVSFDGVGGIRSGEPGGHNKGDHSTGDPHKLPPMGSWQCPYCREFKDAKESRCCGKIREVRRGYWLCQGCSSVNRKEREVCIGCGKTPALAEEHWTCVVCELENTKDSLLCRRCGAEHASLWRCPSCRLAVPHAQGVCPTCAASKPDVPAAIVCPVCQAPNASVRMACFRCHARLQLSWRCARCGATHADRTHVRCPACHAPHIYDEAEETWVCALCASAIASGGDLPVRWQCPKCLADRLPACLSFPSRWRCARCGIFDRTANPQCVECGAPRRLPETFHTSVTCPQCFGQTELNAQEECGNCGFSLSDMLTVAGAEVVHVHPAPTASRFPRTTPHELSGGHETAKGGDDAGPLSCAYDSVKEALKQANPDSCSHSGDEISCERTL